jgi:putative glycosyltransferase
LVIFVLSLATIAYYLFQYFFFGIGVDGFTSLIISIWFFGGLTTLILGVLGIYIASILSETKRRPYTVVRRVHRADHAAAGASNVVRVPGPGQRLDTGAHR